MTSMLSKRNNSLLLLFFIISLVAKSQHLQGFVEPKIDLNWDPSGRWSYHFEVGNRNLIYEKDSLKLNVQNAEFTHFTAIKLGLNGTAAGGIRYRFREIFDEVSTDELRLMQQYTHKHNYDLLGVAHRFRLEERFRENTSFRNRYRFSVQFPLNGESADSNDLFLKAKTETLWSLGKYEKPSLDQWTGLYVENRLLQDLSGEIGLEYRLKDYTQNTTGEIFLSTKLNISI